MRQGLVTMLARSIAPGPGETEAPDILAEQVRLLYAGTFAIPANGVNAAIVTAALWRSYPTDLLLGWVGVSVVVVAARLVLRQRYRRAAASPGPAPRRW